MATAAPSSFIKPWQATDKGRDDLSGTLLLSGVVQSRLLASYCLSGAGGAKEVEKPRPLGSAQKASDQRPHGSEILHPVFPFRTMLLVLWNVLRLRQRALQSGGKWESGVGSARALLLPGRAQLDGENIIMYGKGEPGTMRGYCLSVAGNLTATECQKSHLQQFSSQNLFQLDRYLTFRVFEKKKKRDELRIFLPKNKKKKPLKIQPPTFPQERSFFYLPQNAFAVDSPASPDKCGSGHTLPRRCHIFLILPYPGVKGICEELLNTDL